ncbi:MAG: hypothetical protein ACJ0Q6_04700 [Candidatus Azotimanducaceae bacterium]
MDKSLVQQAVPKDSAPLSFPPLNDTIKPKVFGFEEIKMSELAERTLQVQKAIAQ